MNFKPIVTALAAVVSLTACTQNETIQSEKVIVLSEAELNLKIEQAKAEERLRIQTELARQEQQKKVFDEILIRQGKEPKFSNYYKTKQQVNTAQDDTSSTSQNLLSNKLNPSTIPIEIDSRAWQQRIIPESRAPQVYREIDGKTYLRCAANALIPTFEAKNIPVYSENNKELSATLCKASRDKNTMLKLQNRLYDLGYLKSDTLSKAQLVDGIWGLSTLEAVKAYQADHGLLLGQLTIQTLEHIGVFSNRQEAIDSTELAFNDDQDSKKRTEPSNSSSETESKIKLAEKLTVAKTEAAPSTGFNAKPVFYREVGGAKYYKCQAKLKQTDKNAEAQTGSEEIITDVLCDSSRDVATITDLQYELYEKGFMPADGLPIGRLISGDWDKRTIAAVQRYQLENELVNGDLTIETLEHLGIFKVAAKPSVSKVMSKVAVSQKEELIDKQQQNSASPKLEEKTELTKPVTVEIPFKALPVILDNPEFNPASDIPATATPQVYARTRGGFELWRCRARALLNQEDSGEAAVYGDVKEYRATLCKKNRSKPLMTRLQTALRDKGYLKPLPGSDRVVIDGIWGETTLVVLKAYQQDHGLAYGQLTIESLEHLGVFLPE